MVPTLPGEIICVFLKCNLMCVETSKCACACAHTHTHTHTHIHTPFSYSSMSPLGGWAVGGREGSVNRFYVTSVAITGCSDM